MSFKVTAGKILGRQVVANDGIVPSIIKQTEEKLNVVIPKDLKQFYVDVGRISLFIDGFQHFASLFGKSFELFVKDNKLIFLQENQGVVYWAVDLVDNKTVYQTVSQDFSEDVEWYAEDFDLKDFLEMLLYFQTVMADDYYHNISRSGYKYFASLNIETYQNNKGTRVYLHNLESHFEQVVKKDGIRIFWKEGTIILFLLNGENEIDMVMSCTKSNHFMEVLTQKYGFWEL